MKLISVFSFLFLMLIMPSFAQNNPEGNNKALLYDTIRTIQNIFDTLKVVDTIYEYEYEYEDLDTIVRTKDSVSEQIFDVPESLRLSYLELGGGMLPDWFDFSLSHQYSFKYTRSLGSKLLYSAGVGLMIKNQSVSFNEQYFFSHEYSKGFWDIDTLDMYYTINSNNDTTWLPITKQTWIDKIDSSVITQTDTVGKRNAVQKKNCFAFFEIPLTFKFVFLKERRFSLAVSGGVHLGAMFFRKEYFISDDQKRYVLMDQLPGFKPSVRMLIGLEMMIPLSDRWTVSLSPGYSYYAVVPLTYISQHQLFLNVGVSLKL